MTVQLEIADGVPWYLSNDIWTVPGDDPTGAIASPIVGQPCYLWARVRNSGTSRVENGTVRFYWANPAVGFDRNTANYIGASNVTLSAGGVIDVLCLTPWIPVYVNQGHECVVAEAFHPTMDPLPPSVIFNVPTDRHVAQRNLGVVQVSEDMAFHFAFEIHNASRADAKFRIEARQGTAEEAIAATKRYPHVQRLLAGGQTGELVAKGFTREPCPRPGIQTAPVGDLALRGGERTGLAVVGQFRGGEIGLVHIEQYRENGQKPIGGLAFLVIRDKLLRSADQPSRMNEEEVSNA
jgi:hypothetical protein